MQTVHGGHLAEARLGQRQCALAQVAQELGVNS